MKIENPQNSRHLEHNDGQDRDIARKGSVAKRCNDPVAYSWGNTSAQKNTAGIGGMGHAVAVVDGGQPSLAYAYGSAADLKSGKLAPPSPGMRSRTNEDCETLPDKVQHGRDMLDCAVKN